MKRLHLFEFEDQKWFPTFLRNYMTDYLEHVAHQMNIYQGLVPFIKNALNRSNGEQIIDLASGGGGGMVKLVEGLQQEIPALKVHLTDYYPNLKAFEKLAAANDAFSFEKTSVDAKNVPAHLKGFRTIFLALHHFRPQDARSILQNAVDAGESIAVFEAQERSIKNFIGMLFVPIMVLLFTPFIRPFSIGRILFTYLIPILPLLILWDGLVSVLRTYSLSEMDELIQGLEGAEGYIWEKGRAKSGPASVLYTIGVKT